MKRIKNLSSGQVKKLAQTLAKKHYKDDVVIGLIGPLGAGKTTFVKHFAETFKIKHIKSPTFIIGSLYPTPDQTIYHYDFYRLEDVRQLQPLGFDEILASKHRIILIEWVDKFPEIAKVCDIVLSFEITGKTTRNVTID